jgi:hypothetical protein
MQLEEIREYCLLKNGVEECLPFGNDTLVFNTKPLTRCLNKPIKITHRTNNAFFYV